MSKAEIKLLKQFNKKFLSWINEMINFAPPDIKEIKLLPTAIDFIINRGDPTKIIEIFYDNMHMYADRIYQDEPDRSLLEEGFIMNQLTDALSRNKDKLDKDKLALLNNKLNDDLIKDQIIYARTYWDSKSQKDQKRTWIDSQILLKLSQKYAQLTGKECNDEDCVCKNKEEEEVCGN